MSGSGEDVPHGSEVKQFCDHARKDANGSIMALGDFMGYSFKQCKGIDIVWNSIAATFEMSIWAQ